MREDSADLPSPSEICSICLEPLDENVETTPCSHHFHEKCIQSWTQQKNECPVCRKKVHDDTAAQPAEPRTELITLRQVNETLVNYHVSLARYIIFVSIFSYVNICFYFAFVNMSRIATTEYNMLIGVLGIIFSSQANRVHLENSQCFLYTCLLVFMYFTLINIDLQIMYMTALDMREIAQMAFGYLIILFQLVFMCFSMRKIHDIVNQRTEDIVININV